MKPHLGNQSGQLIVEAVLIIVVLLAATFTAASFFKDQELLKKLIYTPWLSMAGMLQNGSWGTPDATSINHPNAHSRHIVIQADPAL